MATQKIAVRRIKRGSDGQIKVVYVDAQTQQELTSLVGYTVNTQNELAKRIFLMVFNQCWICPMD